MSPDSPREDGNLPTRGLGQAGRTQRPGLAKLKKFLAPSIVVVLAAAAVAVIAMAIPRKDRTAKAGERPPVNVEVLRIRAIPKIADTLTLEACIEPNRVVDVSTEVAGRVEKIVGTKGSQVKQGQTLLKLNRDLIEPEYQRLQAQAALNEAEIRRSRAQRDFDEKEFQRLKDISSQGVVADTELKAAETKLQISQAALDASEAMLKASRAALAAAKAVLDRTEIVAPISGILDDVPTEEGQYVRPGDPVARIVDRETFKVVVYVPERDIGFIQTGSPATVILNDRAGEGERSQDDAVEAKVTYVSALSDEGAHTTRVEIAVANREYELSTGQGIRLHDRQIVRARLTRGAHQNVLMVPLRTVIPGEKDRVVYIVEGDEVKQIENIQLGFFKGEYVQVRNGPRNGNGGLKAGDLLIYSGQQFVAPGQKVAIRKTHEMPDFK